MNESQRFNDSIKDTTDKKEVGEYVAVINSVSENHEQESQTRDEKDLEIILSLLEKNDILDNLNIDDAVKLTRSNGPIWLGSNNGSVPPVQERIPITEEKREQLRQLQIKNQKRRGDYDAKHKRYREEENIQIDGYGNNINIGRNYRI